MNRGKDSVRSTVAIIPARGGSKRLAGKNIIEIGGRPMVAWTIDAAIASGEFDRVIVSTDDAAIADIARQWGAEVPFLRDRAADDFSAVSDATIAALDQLEHYDGTRPHTVVQLMPNCPMRGAGEITSALERFREQDVDALISCFRLGWMNPWWAVTLDQGGYPKPVFPEALAKRSQDLPSLYCPSGAIWIAKAEALRRAGTFYAPGHTFFPIPWQSAVDIDDCDDLEFAEVVWSLRHREKQLAV